ncbi:MAG: glycosyltransferase family 9 protein [Patescibacteria group bacterium]|nr:glycosyltransferase family 9 protein [Patescibacteria group bacterium]
MLRLTNLQLFLESAGHCLLHGRATALVRQPFNIAVVQTGKLGDMVCTTPVFRAIKTCYPEARVWVVGDRVNEELLEYNPDVDEYLVYEKNLREITAALRRAKIDVGVSISPSPDAVAMLYLAGARLVVAPRITNGFTPLETHAGRLIKKFVAVAPLSIGAYAPREYLKLLEPLGIESDDTKKHLGFSSEAGRHVRDFFVAHGLGPGRDLFVGIVPGTGYAIKLWPRERFAALAEHLSKSYQAKIVLLGAPSDRVYLAELADHLDKLHVPYANAGGLFTIDEFKAVVARLSLVIGVDTGTIYVAEAFGVPTVDIVGPMDEREQPPIGRLNKVVIAERRAPQIHIMNVTYSDEREARRQSEDISVEMVRRAVDELMVEIATES